MKKIHLEILFGVMFVIVGTMVAYQILSRYQNFWTAQNVWNNALILSWAVVAGGYWNQGMIIQKAKSASHVSLVLPFTVFFVQCILFVKGIYYHDTALIAGPLIVNCAVVFDLYQILKYRYNT